MRLVSPESEGTNDMALPFARGRVFVVLGWQPVRRPHAKEGVALAALPRGEEDRVDGADEQDAREHERKETQACHGSDPDARTNER